MQKASVDKEREKAVYQYITALDRGDIEEIGIVLKAAEKDRELERIIREVNLAYQQEGQADDNHPQ